MTVSITNEELFRRLRKAEVNIANLQQTVIRLSRGKSVATETEIEEAPVRASRKSTVAEAPAKPVRTAASVEASTIKIVDKYTEMDAEKLQRLVIGRGGNPIKIMTGFHARGRTNALRNWLRANPKLKTTTPDKVSVKAATRNVQLPKANKPKVRSLG